MQPAGWQLPRAHEQDKGNGLPQTSSLCCSCLLPSSRIRFLLPQLLRPVCHRDASPWGHQQLLKRPLHALPRRAGGCCWLCTAVTMQPGCAIGHSGGSSSSRGTRIGVSRHAAGQPGPSVLLLAGCHGSIAAQPAPTLPVAGASSGSRASTRAVHQAWQPCSSAVWHASLPALSRRRAGRVSRCAPHGSSP